MPTRNLSAYELARLATKGFLATITALFQSGICKKNQYNSSETYRAFEYRKPKSIRFTELMVKLGKGFALKLVKRPDQRHPQHQSLYHRGSRITTV